MGSFVPCAIISFALYNPTKQALGGHLCVCMCVYAGKTLSGQPFQGRWVAAAAKSLQSCPTLCDPIDGSPPDSPVPGILQARTLEWVAISFSNA